MRKKKLIAVIGAGEATPEEEKLAEEVGEALGKKGVILVCGGLGGVMEAACRGAASEKATIVGILPSDNPHAVNRYVQIPIVTGMGQARNVILVKSAAAVIAIGGGYGTLSEIGHALRSGIPVVGLKTWDLSKDNQADTSMIKVETAQAAVEIACELAEKE